MRGRHTSRGAGTAVAVLVACFTFASGSGAATGDLKVVTQFQPPAAGQIELIATTYQGRFTGSAAPAHPLSGVTLPGAGPPHTYGLLSGDQLVRVQGDVATYVWLTVALKPLGAKPNHDQPLVGESRNITSISSGSGLHNQPEALTIDTSNPTELAAFGSALRADGVSSLSAASFRVWAYDNRSVFHWTLAKEYGVWNDVMATITALHSSTTLPIGKIVVLTGYQFAGGPGSTGSTSPTGGTSPTSGPTVSGTLIAGTLPSTVDLAVTPPSSGIDALKLVTFSPNTIKAIFAPKGWTCPNTSVTVVECKGATLTGPFTMQLGYTGTTLRSLWLAGSSDGAKAWGEFDKLAPTPTSPSTPGGSSSSIGPLEACVDVTPTGSTTVENVKILDAGATGLKGTVTFNGQGEDSTEPFDISTTGLTATPFVVTKPGTSTITISVALPGGKTQQLTINYTLNNISTTSTGCTPHQ